MSHRHECFKRLLYIHIFLHCGIVTNVMQLPSHAAPTSFTNINTCTSKSSWRLVQSTYVTSTTNRLEAATLNSPLVVLHASWSHPRARHHLHNRSTRHSTSSATQYGEQQGRTAGARRMARRRPTCGHGADLLPAPVAPIGIVACLAVHPPCTILSASYWRAPHPGG